MIKIFKRWIIQKEFWGRLSLSVLFIALLCIHHLIPTFKFDIVSIIFIVLAISIWFTRKLTSLEIPGIMKIDLKDFDNAKTAVAYSAESDDKEIEIKWNQEEKRDYDAGKVRNNILTFQARINYTHEAGANYLLRVFVNGEALQLNSLLNKPIVRENADGRKNVWFDEKFDSWMLCYSPNFSDNYSHPIYKVINGDPYLFVLDIGKDKDRNDKIEVVLKHNGRSDKDALRNSIIVKNLDLK